ncbi:MAG: hypothetical protein ACRC17_03130 [Culicoidibacterales bacterium]
MRQSKIEKYDTLLQEYTKIGQEIKQKLHLLELQYESHIQLENQNEAQKNAKQIRKEIGKGEVLLRRVQANKRELEFKKAELQQNRGWVYKLFPKGT